MTRTGERNTRARVLMVQGTGSHGDIANMAVAEAAGARVLLVADIDRGGALAWVVGTLELLTPQERARVRGILINKFRGDRSLLQPGLDFLEERTGVPVLGVIPYLPRIGLPEEDTLSDEPAPAPARPDTVQVAVLCHPHLANFTDFEALAGEPDVALRFVGSGQPLGRPDVVVLPGSKNTLADLDHLRVHGYDAAIRRLGEEGAFVVGLCGGYQMMGLEVADPLGVEGRLHGLFDHPGFRRRFLNRVRSKKGLAPLPPAPEVPPDEPYRQLAQALRESVDVEAVYRLMG